MSEALQTLNLPPEAVALIKEGSPKPRTPSASPKQVPEPTRSEPPEPPRIAEKPVAERLVKVTAVSSSEPSVSRSFRLPESLPPALLRASTERRITKKPPFTQEDIVTEAITQWLKRNGHL